MRVPAVAKGAAAIVTLACMAGLKVEEFRLMQTSLIIESNGSGKDKLDNLLKEGWTVQSITANHGKSYNDFLIILEK